MIVRRLLAGVLLASIAVPALAAAPHGQRQKADPLPVVVGMGTRVFARADGQTVAQASASPTPAASGSPAPGDSPVPAPAGSGMPAPRASASPAAANPAPGTAEAARVEFISWQDRRITYSHYISEAREAFPPLTVATISLQRLKPLGMLKSFTQVAGGPSHGVYQFRAVCENGTIDMVISWNDSGKIQFIAFRTPT
jgi:hypothetical protein